MHKKTKEVCMNLVTVCKTMSQAVHTKCPEEKFLEHIRSVAVSALNVSSTITSHLESRDAELREKAELQENFLSDYTKSLRESIVTLVRHTRTFYGNPLDFMSQQHMNNTLKEVAGLVKSLIDASKGTCRIAQAMGAPKAVYQTCPWGFILINAISSRLRPQILLYRRNEAFHAYFWADLRGTPA